MKSLLLLFILYFVFSIEVAKSQKYETDMMTHLKRLNSVIDEVTYSSKILDMYKNLWKSKVHSRLFSAYRETITDVNKKIKKAAEEIKSSGNKTDNCYCQDKVIDHINKIYATVYKKLNKCNENLEGTMDSIEQNIQIHVSNGNLLIRQLNLIVTDCLLPSPSQAERCEEKINNFMPAINNFKDQSKELDDTGEFFENIVAFKFTKCSQEPTTNFERDLSDAKMNFDRCNENIFKKEKVEF